MERIGVKDPRNQCEFPVSSEDVGAKSASIDKILSMLNAKPLLRGRPWGAPEPFQAQQNRRVSIQFVAGVCTGNGQTLSGHIE